MYGTLLEAILFYNKLKGVLVDPGFKINKHNEYTFNKMISSTQCTIQMHVDDLKLNHVHQEELKNIIDQLNNIFGSDGELLEASYGKIHKYLGMTIDWTIDGKVMFTMYDYLEDIMTEVPADFDGEDVTPAVSDLF